MASPPPAEQAKAASWANVPTQSITAGGVDFAFEVVGTQKTIEQAVLATHRGGTCVIVGVSPAGTRISVDPSLFLQQRILTGSSFGGGHQRTDVPMLIALYMSGKYKLDELISRRLPLSELNEGFEVGPTLCDLFFQGRHRSAFCVSSSSLSSPPSSVWEPHSYC